MYSNAPKCTDPLPLPSNVSPSKKNSLTPDETRQDPTKTRSDSALTVNPTPTKKDARRRAWAKIARHGDMQAGTGSSVGTRISPAPPQPARGPRGVPSAASARKAKAQPPWFEPRVLLSFSVTRLAPRRSRPCPRACRTKITGGTKIGGRSDW